MNVMGHEKLPLEIHQQVLRRCTPSSVELRNSASRRLAAGNKPTNPHIHEGRFQTIVRNIRADDAIPTLDDYHFILEQFAAVGHHVGAMHVYKELKHLGWKPRTKTFGLCLQAIAHRLTFSESPLNKPRRVTQTRHMIGDLVTDMQGSGIPFTSVNLDLTIRILKETSDMEGFEALMKWGYGIDLANPDCSPLEYLGAGTIKSDLGLTESTIPDLPQPQPFSTAALNTTIDVLGRFGNVSRLVQAFETLTQPLPQAKQHQFSSFDDEDDFGVAGGQATTNFTPPHARPNITSYNMLLRHLCRAGHGTLARHYLNEVKWLDRRLDSELRRMVHGKDAHLHKIPAPHLAINRGTLLPIFGESNRDKDIGLMRWLLTKIPAILRRKRSSLQFYSQIRSKWLEKQANEQHVSSRDSPSTELLSPSFNLQTPALEHRTPAKHREGSVFDVNLDTPPTISPTPVKYFDINLHIRLLERDLEELEAFAQHAESTLGRNTQRLKERLSRRVWSEKDVYLSTEGRRVKVERSAWRDMVRFQPRPNAESSPSPIPAVPTRTAPSNRTFSTFFSSNNGSLGSDGATGHSESPSSTQLGLGVHRR